MGLFRVPAAIVALAVSLSLCGCSTSFSPAPEAEVAGANIAPLGGATYGGQQPVTGAHIYMFAADTTGYGHASDSLIQPYSCTGSNCYPSVQDANGNYYVVTNANGSFGLAKGEYACAVGQQVYMYSVGGNASLGNNSYTGLLGVLGTCAAGGAFPGVTRILLNEISTVAAAYALAGYATDAIHVANAATDAAHQAVPGATALATTGLNNAFANASNMNNISVSSSTGALSVTPTGGVVPQAEINTIADSIAACVNSDGTGVSCSNLIDNIGSTGYQSGALATDTATVAIYIAHSAGDPNVTSTVLSNFNQSPPFQPIIAYANDLSVAISFPMPAMRTPASVAIDGSGNAWVVGTTGNTSGTSPGIGYELSPLGAQLQTVSTGPGSPTPLAVSIDGAGNAWIADATNEIVVNRGGTTSLYVDPSLSYPDGVAFDNEGNAWVSNGSGLSLTEFSSSVTELQTFSTPYLSLPRPIRIGANDVIWIADATEGLVDRMDTSGDLLSKYTVYRDVANFTALALDGSGAAWVSDSYNSCFVHINSAGLSYAGDNACYYGNLTSTPSGLAMDGLGNVILANQSTSSLEIFNNLVTDLTPNGLLSSKLVAPYGLAVDSSGDVWVAGRSGAAAAMVEFIGTVAPTSTPVLPGSLKGTLDTRP